MRRLLVGLALFVLILGAGVIWTATPGTDEAYDLARARIAAAAEDDTRVLRFDDLPQLGTLPPEIATLDRLIRIDLRGTKVEDITALADLDGLKFLSLHSTLVRDIGPLAGLPSLEMLDIGETWVADIAPLVELPALRRLDLGHTQLRSLEPATRIPTLEWINLHGGYAIDGSAEHYQTLVETGRTVNNGRAFREDYQPDWLDRTRVRIGRIVHRARLGLNAR